MNLMNYGENYRQMFEGRILRPLAVLLLNILQKLHPVDLRSFTPLFGMRLQSNSTNIYTASSPKTLVTVYYGQWLQINFYK